VPTTISVKLRPFQARVQAQARQLLDSIKRETHPMVLLVGFPVDDEPPWCEPSEEADPSEILAEVAALRTLGKPTTAAEEESAALRSSLSRDHRRTAIFSEPVLVDGTRVHIVVTVDTMALEATPRLPEPDVSGPTSVRGIIEALILTLVDRCKAGLNALDPGAAEDEVLGGEELDIGLRAVRRMVKTALTIAEQPGGWQVASKLQRIVSQPYEGRWNAGRLIIVSPDHPALTVHIQLAEPISLDRHRSIRKLLESSGPDLAVLMDARHVYGLGTIVSTRGHREKLFEVAVDPTGGWGLSYAGRELFRVKDSLPWLPEAPLDHLPEVIGRVFGNECNVKVLTDLANAAAGNQHGAMLIISKEAAHEAVRLAPQAMRTELKRKSLPPRILGHLTNMDGGVLVDPHGRCHAIGVILDGVATEKTGSPARGSRFNNSVRYLAGQDVPATIVLCYSSDGDIKILTKPDNESAPYLLD
jgi:sensor domain DACNH-containing protein